MPIELERLYTISVSTTMRFSGNLRLKLLNWWAPPNQVILRHKHNTSADELCLRSLSGLNAVHCMRDDDAPKQDSVNLLKETNLALKLGKFPCIKIGDSPQTLLYGEDIRTANIDSDLMEEIKVVEKTFLEPWDSLGSTLEEPSLPSFKEENLEEFVQKPFVKNVAPWESVFDRSVQCLPDTSVRKAKLLEKSGFPTIRKLLNHFPKSYADLHNAQGAIEEGSFFMFTGKVTSSKGLRGKSQLGIVEVIVRCEFQNPESNSNEKEMVFFHLKQFFRGRFAYQPVLNKMASKYKEGDYLHISGEKRTSKNHYDMTQFNIDMLNEEQEAYALLEQKPYPVYSSKAGLKPTYIHEVISGVLKTLNDEIDPMPSELLH